MNYKKSILYSLAILLAALACIIFVDIPLATFIKNNTNQTIINIFSTITVFGSFTYIVTINIVILLYLLIRQNKEKAKLLLYGSISQSATAIAIQMLKFIFGRTRPFYYLKNIQPTTFTFFNYHSNFVSFPSGHSAGIWALTTCLIIIFKDNKYSKLLIIPAFLVSISRLILNVHFLSDIFIGAILGIILSKYFLIRIIAAEKYRN